MSHGTVFDEPFTLETIDLSCRVVNSLIERVDLVKIALEVSESLGKNNSVATEVEIFISKGSLVNFLKRDLDIENI